MTQPHFLQAQLTTLAEQLADFERQILVLAQEFGLTLADYEIDHIALRVNTLERGQQWLAVLQANGEVISDNIINGRPIYLIKLRESLQLFAQSIAVIELPMPKKRYPVEGWEHIEVVLPALFGETPSQWCERILEQFKLKNKTALCLKIDAPKGEGERLDNTTISITKLDNSKNKCCIKLHSHSIIEVINSESEFS
ncbi:VOC family protein [Pasteurellaceae bacterium HPA106]|uniref:VOC family protein n=1 Tax=Spirabiliibacterium pneumoniae TaxID=221400 RepID=UPI001AACFA26|nr:VOC family protein [Spirabiliibacterium pneumoniae]MBE2896535.1 VOC family protein [Spirabiliibacterium pneumoniae]